MASSFAAALARTSAGFIGMLACSPVVPGSERNQVSSLLSHTYIITNDQLKVKDYF
mgnify:CR=1 FL=1|tara:strand:- start:975 stop:1142 length:168 start_codon:yes stop_codon:yes gene_type:complete